MLSLPPTAKRIVSIAFFAALVFLGARTCSVESAHCELVFRVPPTERAQLRELEVWLYETESTELVGQFHKYYELGTEGPAGRWPLAVSAGHYRLEGQLHTRGGVRAFERAVELVDGETLVLNLERYLRDRSSSTENR